MLGKFKKPLKEKCPVCGNPLQIRVFYEESLRKGEEISIPVEYIRCSNPSCYYEREIEKQKKRHREKRHNGETT